MTLPQRLRDMMWPTMGWKRTLRYYQYRLARHPRSPEELAASLAIGAMVTFVPIPASHAAITVFTCWGFRLPIVPGLIGTLVGNPWTVPVAWWSAYRLGDWGCDILDIDNGREPISLSIHMLRQMKVEDFMALMVPTTIAGVILAVLSWPIFYYVFLLLLREAKAAIVLFRKARRALKNAVYDQPS